MVRPLLGGVRLRLREPCARAPDRVVGERTLAGRGVCLQRAHALNPRLDAAQLHRRTGPEHPPVPLPPPPHPHYPRHPTPPPAPPPPPPPNTLPTPTHP